VKSPVQVFQQVLNGAAFLLFDLQQAAKAAEVFGVSGRLGIGHRSPTFADPGINPPKVLGEQFDEVRALTLIRAGTRGRRMVGPDGWPRHHRQGFERNAMGWLMIATEVGTVCATRTIGYMLRPLNVHQDGAHFISVVWGSCAGLVGR
jgi:hypothetical protein